MRIDRGFVFRNVDFFGTAPLNRDDTIFKTTFKNIKQRSINIGTFFVHFIEGGGEDNLNKTEIAVMIGW